MVLGVQAPLFNTYATPIYSFHEDDITCPYFISFMLLCIGIINLYAIKCFHHSDPLQIEEVWYENWHYFHVVSPPDMNIYQKVQYLINMLRHKFKYCCILLKFNCFVASFMAGFSFCRRLSIS